MVDVPLADPCNADSPVDKPTPENQILYVNDPAFSYPLQDQFSVTPAVCGDKLSITVPDEIKDYLVWSEDD